MKNEIQAGTEVDSSTTDEVTSVSQPCTKPLVVRRFLSRLWNCKIWKFHDWTSAAQQGLPPTKEQLDKGIEGYWDYATMYCKRCGHISHLSNRLKCNSKN